MDGKVIKFEHAKRAPRPPRERIGVYKCSLDVSGEPFQIQTKPLMRRYLKGGFSEKTLLNVLMPDLSAKCNMKGWSYPLLITSYLLKDEKGVVINVPSNKKATSKNAIFDHRPRETPEKWVAVVLSPKGYKLL